MENPSSTTRFDRVGREGWVTSLCLMLRAKQQTGDGNCVKRSIDQISGFLKSKVLRNRTGSSLVAYFE